MKQSVIKLALHGLSNRILVENLLAMNPEYWFIERLIDGVHVPTVEEFAASKNYEIRNVQIQHKSDLDKDNLFISYDYVTECYSSEEITKILEEDEYKKLDTSWHKDDKHPYKVHYWAHSSDWCSSEKFESND